MKHELIPFIISLLIGLFIGIERERNHPPGSQAMGVRTFILIALIGTLAATAKNLPLTLTGSLFVFALITLSYYRAAKTQSSKRVVGITTETAAATVFFLGYLTPTRPLLSALIAIAVLLALFARATLHEFSRDTLKTKEIYATMTILVIALGILPFLPNHTIDPWQAFNPRQYIIIVLLLLIIQFLGYTAIRIFGHRIGMLLTGFFGGLVSSTSIFLMLPKMSKTTKQNTHVLVATGIFATNAMLIETILLLYIISPLLLSKLIIPILGMLAVGFMSAWPIIQNKKRTAIKSLLPNNPFDFWSVLKLASFFAGMLAIISICKRAIGINAVHIISFLGGLFEIHSVNVANATLFAKTQVGLNSTLNSIALTISASFITKYFLLVTMARNRFALICSIHLSIMLVVGASIFFMMK